MRLLPLLACLAPIPAWAGAVLVTTVKGDVQLVDQGAHSTVPTPPFVLGTNQSLAVGAGGIVVLLHDGDATQVQGPTTIDSASLKVRSSASMATPGVLDELINRQASSARAGATRSGPTDLVVSRPLPGTAVVGLHEIRWACTCDPQTVSVYDFSTGEVVWTKQASGHVNYDGPALHPGAWSVNLGGHDFMFVVLSADEQKRVESARSVADSAAAKLKASGVSDPASLVALPAGIYAQADLPSDALWLVDQALVAHPGNADLLKLEDDYVKRAGQKP